MIYQLKVKSFLAIVALTSLLIGLFYPCLSFCTYVLTHERQDVISHIIGILDKPHLYKYFDELYTPQKHLFAKTISWLIYAICLLAIFLMFKRKRVILERIVFFTENSVAVVRQFIISSVPVNPFEKISFFALLSVALSTCIYSIFTSPITFDEADTWMLFISKGPIFISSFYPFPNNHIFYNWCVWALSLFPISPSILLRIPLIPAVFFTVLLFYRYTKNLFDVKTGLASSFVFIFSFSFLFYNHLGRGYLFVLLFGILLLYGLRQAEKGFRKRYTYAICLALTLGTYTIPSFIYLSIPVMFFYLFRFYRINKTLSFHLLRISAITCLIVFILYAPVLLASGNYNFFNQYAPVPWIRVLEVGNKVQYLLFNFIFGYSTYKYFIAIIFITGLLKAFINKRFRWFSMLVILVFLMPIFFFLIQRQIYPARVFIHLIIFSSIVIGFFIVYMKKSALAIISFCIFFPLYVYNNQVQDPKLIKLDKMNNVAPTLAKKIIKENRRTVFFRVVYMKPLIDYYTRIKNYKLELIFENSRWKRNDFNVNKAYDVIVWKQSDTIPSLKFTYDTVYRDSTVVVLFRKK